MSHQFIVSSYLVRLDVVDGKKGNKPSKFYEQGTTVFIFLQVVLIFYLITGRLNSAGNAIFFILSNKINLAKFFFVYIIC